MSIDVNFTADNRLFPGNLLYCEGRPKPLFRGKLHALGAVALCPYWWINTYSGSNVDDTKEAIALLLFFMGTVFCWACSALYHCKNWKVNEEILIQRLDHCGIFILVACIFTALGLLTFDRNISHMSYALVPALFLQWICAGYGIFRVFGINQSSALVKICAFNVIIFLPIIPLISSYLTNFEKLCVLVSLVTMAIGGLAFSEKMFDILPCVFGHHEVFHLCSLVALHLMYVTYISISKDQQSRCEEEFWLSLLYRVSDHIFGFNRICQ